jgi:SAM-dependent methyltransferase
MTDDYRSINSSLWNKWAKLHLDSAFYDMDSFRCGTSSLIGPEVEILGDVSGKKILHLQCHFGQDTLSLARMGAQVTGVDFSEEAILAARKLNDELGLDARFICADVLDMQDALKETFDLVFTSYGVLYWLPDLVPWAATVDRYLNKKGRLLIVEFHPVMGMYNDDFSALEYGYFRADGFLEEEAGSYAVPDAKHITGQSLTWDFSLSELITTLLNRGFSLSHFVEYDYSPYNLFKNSVKVQRGFQVQGLEGKIPLIFSLEMTKPMVRA